VIMNTIGITLKMNYFNQVFFGSKVKTPQL